MSTPTYEKIIDLLNKHAFEYQTQHHEPTITSADASRVRGVDLHAGAKAIVVRGSKTGSHYLFVMPADLRLDGKKVKKIVGENISFAQDPVIVTGCVRGSVPPLGSIIGLKTYVDRRLAENETIHFNAGSLTDSVSMTYQAYVEIEKPEVVDIVEALPPPF